MVRPGADLAHDRPRIGSCHDPSRCVGEVTVTFENVASDGFDVVCTPDAAIEKYYVYVLKTSSLPMQVLMAGGLEAFKKEVMPTKDEYTGTQTIRKTGLAAEPPIRSVCWASVRAAPISGSRRHRRPKRLNKKIT